MADKFRGEGYSRLFVRGQRQLERYFFDSKSLIAPVFFDSERYKRAWGDGTDREVFSEYVFDLFRQGFSQAAAAGAPIPLELLEGYMKDFRQGGYTNSWVHSAKLFRALGVHATLECSLDCIRFSLVLVIREGSAKGPIVFRRQILKTLPDYIIFYWRFKEVVAKKHSLVVLDSTGKTLFQIDTRKLE
jgi:hypothetical protein